MRTVVPLLLIAAATAPWLVTATTIGTLEVTTGQIANMYDDSESYWVFGYRSMFTQADPLVTGGFRVLYANQNELKAHVAKISGSNVVTDVTLSFSQSVSEVKGFYVHSDGSFACAYLVATTKYTLNSVTYQLYDTYLAVYTAANTLSWSVKMDTSQVPDTNHAKLDYGLNDQISGTPTGYYFIATTRAANGTCSSWALGHWANIEYFVDASTHAVTNIYCWGCSHSWTQGLSYNAKAKWALDLCSWDGGGIYHLDTLAIAAGDTCSLGQVLPLEDHWLVSYNCPRSGVGTSSESSLHDVGIAEVWDSPKLKSNTTTWVTTTSTLKGGVIMTPWGSSSDYLVGWMETSNSNWIRTDVKLYLGRINRYGKMKWGPTAVTSTLWWQGKGEAVTLSNGDIVWGYPQTTYARWARLTPTDAVASDATAVSETPIAAESSVATAAACTLASYTTTTGVSAWGTCAATVASGKTCAYTCKSGYTSTTGQCNDGAWTVTPACTASPCTLSSTLPTGASGWGTCTTGVSSGSTCAFACKSGYASVTGSCTTGTWTTSPSCKKNTCTLTTLPTGASSLGGCSSSISSGSTCSVTCSSGYTAVAGTCGSSGTWTTTPSCTKSTTCSLSSTLPTGASGWGTCSTSFAEGECEYDCFSGYDSVTGVCSSGSWTTAPNCTASPCSITALADGASGWGTCSASVDSGESCSFGCSDSYTAVAGYCSAGTWTTEPSCTGCTSESACGTQTCGSFWNGCETISCGNCSSGYTCNGTQCLATSLDNLNEWEQVAPDSYTSLNWKMDSSVLTLTNFTLTSKERIVSYVGAQSSWFSEGYTTASVDVVASEGTVGFGLRLGQGTGRTLDRITWKIVIGTTATAKYCRTYKGTESCTTVASKLSGFSTTSSNNFTIQLVVGTSYINSYAWLNGVSLTTGKTEYATRYTSVGKLFLMSKGSAAKKFTDLTVRSKTAVHVVLTECMSEDSWTSFVANLLGIDESDVSTRGLGSDAKCSSKKRASRRGAIPTYSEFEMLLSDNLATSTPSSAMYSVLQNAVHGGAASWSGISVASLSSTTPLISAAAAATAGGFGAAAALSTGAIAAIAACGGAAVVGGAAAVTIVVAKKMSSSKEEPAKAETGEKRKTFIQKMFRRDGVDVMNNPSATHSSITNRAPPVAVEM